MVARETSLVAHAMNMTLFTDIQTESDIDDRKSAVFRLTSPNKQHVGDPGSQPFVAEKQVLQSCASEIRLVAIFCAIAAVACSGSLETFASKEKFVVGAQKRDVFDEAQDAVARSLARRGPKKAAGCN